MEQIDKFKERKKRMIDYCLLKVEEEDWHGVADAANDIREIVVQIKLLESLGE